MTLNAFTVVSCEPTLQNMNHNLLPPAAWPVGRPFPPASAAFPSLQIGL